MSAGLFLSPAVQRCAGLAGRLCGVVTTSAKTLSGRLAYLPRRLPLTQRAQPGERRAPHSFDVIYPIRWAGHSGLVPMKNLARFGGVFFYRHAVQRCTGLAGTRGGLRDWQVRRPLVEAGKPT
jgi:hypothetical protein